MSKNRYASKGIDNSKQTFYHFEKGGNKQDPRITFPAADLLYSGSLSFGGTV